VNASTAVYEMCCGTEISLRDYRKSFGAIFVKNVQRSFVVEYKSGRRKTDAKSNSIWGNLDLKTVARNVQEEAMPFITQGMEDGVTASQLSLTDVRSSRAPLPPSIRHQTTATVSQDTILADEKDTRTHDDAPASVVAAINPPKKQRKRRAQKAALESAPVEVPALVTAVKRARQARVREPQAVEDASSSNRAGVKRAAKAVRAVTATTPIVVIYEMADLPQLEEENQRLRKLLGEKLRAENADLRRWLDLGRLPPADRMP
jgi:hypothetical protein